MEKEFILYAALFVMGNNIQAQNMIKFDTLWVYNFYTQAGFTTTRAIVQFDKIIRASCEKNIEDVDKFNQVLKKR